MFSWQMVNSAAEKRGLWEGVVQEPLRRALFCVFLSSEVIFSCKSHSNFFQKLPFHCRHFLENPLAKNPKTQLLINGGLANGGLRYLCTIGHDCLRLSSFCDEKFPLERGPKRPQKCTIVDDCAQIAESGLKPPFESPHLDFPERKPLPARNPCPSFPWFFWFYQGTPQNYQGFSVPAEPTKSLEKTEKTPK